MIPYLWEKPFTQSSCKSDDHFRGAPQKPGRKHCRRPRWVKTLIYQAYTQLVLVQVCRAWAQFIPSLKYLIKICCRKMEKEYPILNSGLGFFFTGKVIRWCCSCRNEFYLISSFIRTWCNLWNVFFLLSDEFIFIPLQSFPFQNIFLYTNP